MECVWVVSRAARSRLGGGADAGDVRSDAELEVQRTVERAELTAVCLLRGIIGSCGKVSFMGFGDEK